MIFISHWWRLTAKRTTTSSAGSGAGDEGQGHPPAELDQHHRHGDEGEAVLQQAAEVFHQGDGAVARVDPGAVEAVVVLGGLVVGEVGGHRAVVDEAADVVGDQLTLGGADKAGERAQQLGEQQQPGHEQGEQQRAADGVPSTAGVHRRHQAVDQHLGEGDDGDGEDALDDEQDDPGDGPAAGGGPDQVEGAGEIGELGADFIELGGDQGGGLGHGGRFGARGEVSTGPPYGC